MKVNMDGLRTALASSYRSVVEGFRSCAFSTNGSEASGIVQIKEGLDKMRGYLGAILCTFDENPDNLMSDLSHLADMLPYADPEDEEDFDDE